MSHQLNFKTLFRYDTKKENITVGVTLRKGELTTAFDAKIDTGSTFCVFEREHGENLGLNIESGIEQRIGTAMGMFTAYGHQLMVKVLEFEIEAYVYFATDYGFAKNVLGRRGWIDMLRVGIIDYDGELYLSYYDSE